MRIAIIAARRTETHYTLFPLRVFREILLAKNITINIHHQFANVQIQKADIIIIVQQYIKSLLEKEGLNALIKFLEYYRNQGKPVIWLDSNDTSGFINKNILSVVSVYAKRQLLKDQNLYLEPMYQGSLFKSYYLNYENVEDNNGMCDAPLQKSELDKLSLYWNLGLIDWGIHGHGRLARLKGIYLSTDKYRYALSQSPLSDRAYDVTCRVSKRNQIIVDTHRERTRKQLLALQHKFVTKVEGTLPYAEYISEMQKSRVVVSPFGWGEICYRDFEGFFAGALLFKPDMSHLDTFPDYYQDGVTYISHRWDFSDFQDKLVDVLENLKYYAEVAMAGQRFMVKTVSYEGGENFAEFFTRLIEKAIEIN